VPTSAPATPTLPNLEYLVTNESQMSTDSSHFGNLAWVGNCKEVMGNENEILQDFVFASPFLQRLRDAAVINNPDFK
jgi:hypothetical protein